MKRIEAFKSFEAVGVPEGLVDISNKLYTLIIKRLKDGFYSINEEDSEPGEYRYPTRHIYFNTSIPMNSKINDYQIERFNVTIDLDVVDFPEDMEETGSRERLAGAGYSPKVKLDRKNFKIIYEEDGDVDIQIRFTFHEPKTKLDNENDYWPEILIETLNDNKTRVISSLGHELMHSYDLGHVKKEEEYWDSSKYQTYSKLRFGIKQIDEFFYYLYYTTRCESIVRSVEVASSMDAQGIDQDKFEEYLSSNETYKMLKEINNWTYEGMLNKLRADIKNIRQIFSSGDSNSDSKISDDAFIENVLRYVVHAINDKSLDELTNKLTVPKLFGMDLIDPEDDATSKEKTDYVNSFIKIARKEVGNPLKYFKDKEKFFHETTNKLIKKLSKLYSIAKPSGSNPIHSKINKRVKNESIMKWNDFGK